MAHCYLGHVEKKENTEIWIHMRQLYCKKNRFKMSLTMVIILSRHHMFDTKTHRCKYFMIRCQQMYFFCDLCKYCDLKFDSWAPNTIDFSLTEKQYELILDFRRHHYKIPCWTLVHDGRKIQKIFFFTCIRRYWIVICRNKWQNPWPNSGSICHRMRIWLQNYTWYI